MLVSLRGMLSLKKAHNFNKTYLALTIYINALHLFLAYILDENSNFIYKITLLN